MHQFACPRLPIDIAHQAAVTSSISTAATATTLTASPNATTGGPLVTLCTVNEWIPKPLPGLPITLAQHPQLPPDEDTNTGPE